MPLPFRPVARPITALAIAALVLGLAVLALQSTSAARAATSACSDAITSAPTGPATVSATTTKYGKVLAVGSGAYEGCSLYLLTSDQLHAINGADFACDGDSNPLGNLYCNTILWPALLTDGNPIAGPGVNPTLLGTVTRNDLPGLGTVQQVTYNGMPLYRFFLDTEPGDTEGANLFDPVTDPTGTWYLVDPSRGRPATGTAYIDLVTAPLGGGSPATVVGARMNNDFIAFPDASFPVYTLTPDTNKSACQGFCAAKPWPPVLTSGRPEAGPGVDQHALGTIVRPDGTHQVTYEGKPLYLFFQDAYIGGLVGTAGINGAGADTPFGVFNTITP